MYLLYLKPQDTIPDVFIWMLCGGKRVAYARIPAQNIVYSLVEEERGKDSGRMQTVFLRVCHTSTVLKSYKHKFGHVNL
jgi:hypothetical protein